MAKVTLGADEFGDGDPEGLAPPCAGDTRQLTCEQRLLLATLRGAMFAYQKGRGTVRADAEAWFASSSEGLFSYRWVCLYLGLDPAYVWSLREQWRTIGHDGTRRHRGRITTREAA